MDPFSLWLTEQGVDVLAALESFALVVLIVVLWGAAISFRERV